MLRSYSTFDPNVVVYALAQICGTKEDAIELLQMANTCHDAHLSYQKSIASLKYASDDKKIDNLLQDNNDIKSEYMKSKLTFSEQFIKYATIAVDKGLVPSTNFEIDQNGNIHPKNTIEYYDERNGVYSNTEKLDRISGESFEMIRQKLSISSRDLIALLKIMGNNTQVSFNRETDTIDLIHTISDELGLTSNQVDIMKCNVAEFFLLSNLIFRSKIESIEKEDIAVAIQDMRNGDFNIDVFTEMLKSKNNDNINSENDNCEPKNPYSKRANVFFDDINQNPYFLKMTSLIDCGFSYSLVNNNGVFYNVIYDSDGRPKDLETVSFSIPQLIELSESLPYFNSMPFDQLRTGLEKVKRVKEQDLKIIPNYSSGIQNDKGSIK